MERLVPSSWHNQLRPAESQCVRQATDRAVADEEVDMYPRTRFEWKKWYVYRIIW